MNEIDKIAQLIIQLIIYFIATGRILEATILMMMVYITFNVFIAFIKAFFGLFLPEQKTPEKEIKERVKIVYIIQNSVGNKIRVEESDEDEWGEKISKLQNSVGNKIRVEESDEDEWGEKISELQKLPSEEKNVGEKQSWFLRAIKFIARIIILTIKTIIILIIVIILIAIIGNISKK